MYTIKDTQYDPTSKIDLSKYATVEHTHEISEVNSLSDSLASKANATHSHQVADVAGLGDTLANHQSAIDALSANSGEDLTGVQVINYTQEVPVSAFDGYGAIAFINDLTAQNYYFDGTVTYGDTIVYLQTLIIGGEVKYLIHKVLSDDGYMHAAVAEQRDRMFTYSSVPNVLYLCLYSYQYKDSSIKFTFRGVGNLTKDALLNTQFSTLGGYNWRLATTLAENSRYVSSDYAVLYEETDVTSLTETVNSLSNTVTSLNTTVSHKISLGDLYPQGSIYMYPHGNSLPSELTALGGWQYLGYIEVKKESSSAAGSSSKIAFYQKDSSTASASGG